MVAYTRDLPLSQIQMGDDSSSDEDEFKRAHELRYARRSQSELSPAKQENGNSNNLGDTPGIVLSVKGIANEYLRRSWMPERAIYTSKQSIASNGSKNASPNVSPTRKVDVVTVSNGLVPTNGNPQEKSMKVTQNGDQLSPSKTPLTAAAVASDSDDSHDEDEFENASDNLSQLSNGDARSLGLTAANDLSDHDSDAEESEVAER